MPPRPEQLLDAVLVVDHARHRRHRLQRRAVAGHSAVPASSQRPHRGHSISGRDAGDRIRVVALGRSPGRCPGAAARRRSRAPSARRCSRAAADPRRVYASSERFSPSTMTATRARSCATTGTRSDAPGALQPLLLLGRQPPRRRSRVVQKRSRAARPTSAAWRRGRRRAAATRRCRAGPSPASAVPPRCRSPGSPSISGCSASSIWSTTSDARSAGSVSNRTRLASDSRIFRASYSSRKNRWSSHCRARSRYRNATTDAGISTT